MVSGTTQTGYTLTIPLTVTDFGTTLKVVGSGGHVQSASGFDIGTFTDATCSTKYPWDLFGYSSSAGTGTLKVKRDVSVSVNTTLNICYGDATISTFQGGAASTVYPSGTKALYHLEAGSPTDAMGSFTGVVTATVSSGTGKVGGGASVANGSGTSNFINLGSTSMGIFNGSGTTLYIEGWFNPTSVNATSPGTPSALGTAASGTSPTVWLYTGNSGQPGAVQFLYAKQAALTDLVKIVTPTSTLTAGVMAYINLYLDLTTAANCRIFVNGVVITSTCTSGGTPPTVLAALGANATIFGESGTSGFAGVADEVLYANALPTGGVLADWVKTRFNNESTPATFITIGSESGAAAFTISPVAVPINNSANLTLTLTGVGTSWVAQTFTISGCGTKSSQTIDSTTSVRLVITTNATACTATVSDGTLSATVPIGAFGGSTGGGIFSIAQ
jgi:hypothetical protein